MQREPIMVALDSVKNKIQQQLFHSITYLKIDSNNIQSMLICILITQPHSQKCKGKESKHFISADNISFKMQPNK